MTRQQRILGLHLPLHAEQGLALLNGVLQYVGQHENLSIADYCYHEDDFDPVAGDTIGGDPPWKGKVAGVVVNASRSPGLIEWLARGEAPVVNTAGDLNDDGIPSVAADPTDVARLTAGHLLELGFRRFLHVGSGRSDGSRDRFASLREALKASRDVALMSYDVDMALTAPDGRIICRPDEESELRELLKSAKKPLAVVAMSDHRGALVTRIAGELKLRIPEDIAVISAGDTNRARITDPPLTSLRVPFEQIGFQAARAAHRLMDGKRLAQHQATVPVKELVMRASTVGRRPGRGANIDQALAVIRRYACEGLRVREIANQLHMSVRTFEMQFAAAVGHTPAEEIRRVRIERAKELLADTDLSLERIAALVGYSHGAYLSEFFREHTGLTPRQYRQQNRQQVNAVER
jgi:LacI family transcriptional regulator